MAVLILFFRFVIDAIGNLRERMREAKPEPLCADCYFAHVQYAANAKRAISCGYGGSIRPMTLDVVTCTDYMSRNVAAKSRVIGFVHEIARAE